MYNAPEYYTLEEAANVLNLAPGEVNRLREQGVLRGYKDGSTWKFMKDHINAYLADSIKKSSSANSNLLSGEGDEEGPTMLAADSADFDAMFDRAADNADQIVAEQGVSEQGGADQIVVKEEDALNLTKSEEVDELALAPEEGDFDLVLAEETEEKPSVDDDELALAPEEGDDDLLLVKEDDSSSLVDEASALVEDEPVAEVESSSAVDLTGETSSSDDDLLHLGSDSGLSLLDEVDVDGSNVSLGDEEGELVLGGSGSGSGSGLNLGSDSGLELLGDSDGDFSLDDDVAAVAEEEDGDGIFELAPEATEDAPVLNLEQKTDADAPTELAGADEGIFELAEDVEQVSSEESDSDSNSASQLIDVDDSASNPFLTEVDDSTSSSLDSFATSEQSSNPFEIDDSSSTESSFGSFDADASESPFGAAPDASSAPVSDGLSFDKSDSSEAFGSSDFGASVDAPVDSSEPVASVSRAPIASTNYTGKDLIFLVPCLIFLILATIGAYELCRTIWSYQEGSFDLTGPVLETIAKMVKLI